MSWQRVTKNNPCYGCGKPDFCRYSDEGGVECKRGPFEGSRECLDKNGCTHWLGNSLGKEANWEPREKVSQPTKVECADFRQLHAVYEELVGQLGLSLEHWSNLKKRGFSKESSVRHGFKTLPRDERGQLAQHLADLFPFWASVPGLYVNRERPWLGGVAGLLIPCRDPFGRITALRVRPDNPGTGGKYRWLTSGENGGPSPRQLESFWLPAEPDTTRTLRVTEGELKAARLAEGTRIPTISAPGVQSLASDTILRWIDEQRPDLVLLCPDRDMHENPQVARSVCGAIERLKTLDIPLKVEVW